MLAAVALLVATRAVSGYAGGDALTAKYRAVGSGSTGFGKHLATTVELQKPFYEAEAYHQDYLTRHPGPPCARP